MGLTALQRRLVRAIMDCNNITEAIRHDALLVVREDKTAKNDAFCKEAINRLEKKNLLDTMSLAANNRNIIVEDCSGFLVSRYYISAREQALFRHIHKMRRVSQRMSEMQIRYLNATLLYGESGTGKTTFGRYIAYRFGLPFIYINLSMTVDSLLGSTSKNISKIFSDLQGIPCVFMMDEVDAIGMMRGSGTKCDDEMARVVISIMQMIDRMSSDMILIAATNRLDVLDEALIRRFSVRHEVKRFSPKENQEMLKRFVDDVPVDFAPDEINDIVERYDGRAQSYLINVLVERIADKVVGGVTEEGQDDIG